MDLRPFRGNITKELFSGYGLATSSIFISSKHLNSLFTQGPITLAWSIFAWICGVVLLLICFSNTAFTMAIKKRHIFVIISHATCFIMMAHSFGFSVTLVAMVEKEDPRTGTADPECPQISKQHKPVRNQIKNQVKFNWDENQQGVILSGFFHGNVLALLISSFVLSRWSAKSIGRVHSFLKAQLGCLNFSLRSWPKIISQ